MSVLNKAVLAAAADAGMHAYIEPDCHDRVIVVYPEDAVGLPEEAARRLGMRWSPEFIGTRRESIGWLQGFDSGWKAQAGLSPLESTGPKRHPGRTPAVAS